MISHELPPPGGGDKGPCTNVSKSNYAASWWITFKSWHGVAQHLEHTSIISNKAYVPSPNHLWAHNKDVIHDATITYISRELTKRKDSCSLIHKDLRSLMKTRNILSMVNQLKYGTCEEGCCSRMRIAMMITVKILYCSNHKRLYPANKAN